MLLIIFGAGASYDHDSEALKTSNYPRLPLSNDLINSNLQYVQQAMTRWPGAIPLLNRLNNIKRNTTNGFNLENELYKELQRNNEAVQAQLLSFMFYVHDIIRNAEIAIRNCNQGNTNYTRLLDRLQQKDIDQSMRIALVTFNYDTLLDSACSQLYPTWAFDDFNDYIEGIPNVRLYKPHGSLNWKKINNNIPHIPYRLSTVKALQNRSRYSIIDHIEQIAPYNFEHSEYIVGGNTITEPILALPYREKTSFVFPKEHKQTLSKDIRKVTHILTIGWRGQENHFQKEFLNDIPSGAQLNILNVNNGGKDINRNLQNALGEKIGFMHSFSNGFTAFLEDKVLLESFLNP